MKIIPLKTEHLEDAAILVRQRVQNLRKQVPLLPRKYEEVTNLLPLLDRMLKADGPGVAVIKNRQLAGFLKGWLMPGFKGKRCVYSPEWANGAESAHSRSIYEQMYQKIGQDWVGDRFNTHYISLFPGDHDVIQGWHWLGFGMLGVDALRGLEPSEYPPKDFKIRTADFDDLEDVMALHEGLRQYAMESPYFFLSNRHNQAYYEEWLANPDKIVWLAFQDGEPIAFLRMGPANDDVATIIYDNRTASIYEAFTVQSERGKGIGATLLAHGIAAARASGYIRCAVDFETMNTLGSRFWFKSGFKPVSLSLMRTINEGVISR